MFSFNLLNQWQKIAIVAITSLLLLVALYLGAAVRIKSTSAGGSTACAKVVTSSGNEFSSYLGLNAAQMRSSSSAADGKTKVIIFTSDVYINPPLSFVAEGHPVHIYGETVAEAGPEAMTSVWIDLNNDGVEDKANETYTDLSSVMANIYVFGGSDENSITCDNISISMTGGEIGAIFAGGLSHSVTTNTVDIQITGGSVHYVDCGSHWDDNVITFGGSGGTNSCLTARNSINVSLNDCVYRSNMPINGLKVNSYVCSDVTVYDYSDHRDVQSYTRFTPTFTNFVSPIEKNCFVMGGNVEIPADKNVEARVLVVKEDAIINNLGTVSLPRCENLHLLEGSIWMGNPVQTTHVNMAVDRYTYSSHYRTCSHCGAQECQGHVWSYTDNSNGTHTKYCGVCGYSYAEDCSMATEYNVSGLIVRNTCKYCAHKVTTTNNTNPTAKANCAGAHRASSTATTVTHYHKDYLAEGLVEYSIGHLCRKCETCGLLLPYRCNSKYYATLSEVCDALKSAGTTTAEVTMLCDAFYNTKEEVIDFDGGTLTLNMAGCNIERPVTVKSGNIKITNSKAGNGHYAHFTKGFSSNSAATISAEGCHFYKLSAGYSTTATFDLKDVRFSTLQLSNVNSRLTLSGKIIVEKNLYTSYYSGTSLPAGYVIGEMLADGTWLPLYDHKSTAIPTYVGPGEVNGYATTSYVALIPCENHKLTAATSQGAAGHSGTCTLCGKKVTESHDMTSGTPQSSKAITHHIKCSLCSYTSGVSYHDYGVDGMCVVCNDNAVASLRGSSSAKKRYFLSFDAAFNAIGNFNNLNKNIAEDHPLLRGEVTICYHDTIAIYEDQPYAASFVIMPFDRLRITGRVDLTVGTCIYIEGNGHTLSSTNSFTVPDLMRSNEKFVDPLVAKHDLTYSASLYNNGLGLMPERGYRAVLSDGYYTQEKCTHRTGSGRNEKDARKYSPITDENGFRMNYHKYECSSCRSVVYESHTYLGDLCNKCGTQMDLVAAARVIGTNYSKTFSTLYSAWNDAVNQSNSKRGAAYTVQLLSDIDMYSDQLDNKWSLKIPVNISNAHVVLDAIDDLGVEHTIQGWYNSNTGESQCVINANNGLITVKSGIFQGRGRGVIEEPSYLELDGGTYLKLEGGTFLKASNGYDCIECSDGVQRCLAEGYILVGENYVLHSNPDWTDEYVAASGTVMRCPHSNYTKYIAKESTCSAMGNEACVKCLDCGAYITSEGVIQSYFPVTPKKGHTYSGGSCIRCGTISGAIEFSRCDANDAQIKSGKLADLSTVWNSIEQWSWSASADDHFTLKLMADVSLAPGETLSNLTRSNKIIIDLNGHNLNMGEKVFDISNRDLVIMDGSDSKGGVMTAGIKQSNSAYSLLLDGAELHTSKFECADLVMIHNAGIYFDGSQVKSLPISLSNVSMEKGCWMTGENCSSFAVAGVLSGSHYEMDLDETIVDLAHDLISEQQICTGDWISTAGSGKFAFPSTIGLKNNVTVAAPNGKAITPCVRWTATMHENVKHTLNGRKCTECGLNTQHYLLHDKTAYSESYAYQYLGAEYQRNFANANVWESLYVPMSVEPSAEYDIADIYSFGQLFDTNGNGKLDAGDDTWLIVDMMTEATVANAPYLIRSKTAGETIINAKDNEMYRTNSYTNSCSTAYTTFTFRGSNTGSTLSGQNANFVMDADGKLSSTTAASVDPLRWHVQATGTSNSAELRQAMSSGIRVIMVGEDISQETALKLLRGESVEVNLNGQHYTLDGRKATTTESGLKVVNGHKVIVK